MTCCLPEPQCAVANILKHGSVCVGGGGGALPATFWKLYSNGNILYVFKRQSLIIFLLFLRPDFIFLFPLLNQFIFFLAYPMPGNFERKPLQKIKWSTPYLSGHCGFTGHVPTYSAGTYSAGTYACLPSHQEPLSLLHLEKRYFR